MVVSTLVLCSVANPEATLQEIHRVLKPGGRFIFLEHVAAPEGSGLRRLQNLAQPAWTTMADGCHPNRETGVSLERVGFESLALRFSIHTLHWVTPHCHGAVSRSNRAFFETILSTRVVFVSRVA